MKKIKELHKQWNKKQDKESWEKLLQEIWQIYHKKLQVYIRQFSPYFDDVSGTASDILIKVFESLADYSSRYSFSTWIYCVARNFLIDCGRKKRISFTDSQELVVADRQTPETLSLKNEEICQVQSAVATLEPGERELIYLCYYEELKYHEIAKITGKPLGTIKYQMSRCRKKLNKTLKREFK